MKANREDDKFMCRLPNGLRDRLARRANDSGRSMNAELIVALNRHLGQPQDTIALKDVFAAHALSGLFASGNPAYNAADSDENIKYAVFRAYRAAELMISERAPLRPPECNDNISDIADAIRSIRDGMGWTQKELADAVGATQSEVSRWERGEMEPGARVFTAIMRLPE